MSVIWENEVKKVNLKYFLMQYNSLQCIPYVFVNGTPDTCMICCCCFQSHHKYEKLQEEQIKYQYFGSFSTKTLTGRKNRFAPTCANFVQIWKANW